MSARDWAGEWFRAYEELGENARIRIGFLEPDRETPQWQWHDHARVDGVSAMIEALRERGCYRRSMLPTFAPRRDWSWRGLADAFRRIRTLRAVRSYRWKDQVADWRERGLQRSPGWECFTREETELLLWLARERKVSLPALFLWTLNQAVAEELERPAGSSALWIQPLTVRTAQNAEAMPNHASFIDTEIRADDSLSMVDERIAQNRRSQVRWLNWYLLQIGRLIGRAGMRRLLRRSGGGRPRVGGLTNMGSWAKRGEPGTEARPLLMPPPFYNQPLTAAHGIWAGQFLIALDLHPSLARDAQRAPRIAARWRDALRSWAISERIVQDLPN